MSIDQTTSNLQEYLAALCASEERTLAELETIRERIRGVEAVLEGYPAWHAALPDVGPGVNMNIEPFELIGCNQMEALAMIAERNQGLLKARPAAKLLMEAGLTNSTDLGNATATVYRRLKDRRDWALHEPGVFRYLVFFPEFQPDYEAA